MAMVGEDSTTMQISVNEYQYFVKYQEALNYGLNMIRAVGLT